MEDFYRVKIFERDAKKDKSLNSKLSYMRFKSTDDRGYDIINFNNNYHHYKNTVNARNDVDKWEAIVEKAGDNQTINTKGVYKDPYDFTDNEKTAHLFKINRLKNIEKLPKMNEDSLYTRSSTNKIKKFDNAVDLSQGNAPLSKSSNFVEKQFWFTDNKDLNADQHSRKKMNMSPNPKVRIMRASLVKRKNMY